MLAGVVRSLRAISSNLATKKPQIQTRGLSTEKTNYAQNLTEMLDGNIVQNVFNLLKNNETTVDTIVAMYGKDFLNKKDPRGDALVHLATKENLPHLVMALGEAGADLNAFDGTLQTCLDHTACMRRRDSNELRVALLTLGADPIRTRLNDVMMSQYLTLQNSIRQNRQLLSTKNEGLTPQENTSMDAYPSFSK